MDYSHQAALSMGLPSRDYWSRLPLLLQRIFPTQELNLCLLHWQVDALPLNHQGSLFKLYHVLISFQPFMSFIVRAVFPSSWPSCVYSYRSRKEDFCCCSCSGISAFGFTVSLIRDASSWPRLQGPVRNFFAFGTSNPSYMKMPQYYVSSTPLSVIFKHTTN